MFDFDVSRKRPLPIKPKKSSLGITRDELIMDLVRFNHTIPENASDYHKFDMILYRLTRYGLLNVENLKESEEEE